MAEDGPVDLWESTRRAFDAMAAAYHDRFPDLRAEQPLDRAMIGVFADHVRAGGDPAVLDAGCGTGRLIGPLRELGLVVTGVDLSPGMLAVARSVHPEVALAAADLRWVPFPDESFAGVVAWYSLINCPPADLGLVLAEIARVLRPCRIAGVRRPLGVCRPPGYGDPARSALATSRPSPVRCLQPASRRPDTISWRPVRSRSTSSSLV
jgi:SAM-dependent methyltransferase